MRLEKKSDLIEITDDFIKIKITKRKFNKNLEYFSLKQIHSDLFYFITQKETPSFHFKGDAILTNLKNFPIGVRTADCLPIFLYSKKYEVIGIIHAGWRSTAKKIIEKVLIFMNEKLKNDLKNYYFIFGPCICEKCYEIRDDMREEFISHFGIEGEIFFNNYKFNLKEANKYILRKYNIPEEKIFDLNLCTICNNDYFYSYRKEKTTKRILNVIEYKKVEK